MRRKKLLALSAIVLGLGLGLTSGQSVAQQEAKLPRVGVIANGGPEPYFNAFRQNFSKLGYVEGRNIVFEPRFAQGQLDRVPDFAVELARLDVDVIVALGIVGARAAQKATTKIPIVFAMVVDPVAVGIVTTMQQPGGNATGITSYDPQQPRKQFELLHELLPKLARVAILSDPDIPHSAADPDWSPIERANDATARMLGLRPQILKIKGVNPDLEGAFAAMIKEGADALVILEVPAPSRHQKQIAELAAMHKLPTMFPGCQAGAGGLITYGTSILNTLPRLAEYVDKVLKGANPGDLPAEINSQRELVFNLKTARAIGVTISPELLKRTDRVIE